MKKQLLFIFFLFLSVLGFSQNLKPIAQKIENAHLAGKNFKSYHLFTKDKSSQTKQLYENAARDITVLQLKKSETSRIVAEQPETLEMTVPFEGHELTVELVKNNIFTDNFTVSTDKGNINYKAGVYYQGIIKGDPTSLAAFSFFEDDVVGIASIDNVGNVVVGKAANADVFVSYSDAKLTGANPFICGFDELAENNSQKVSFDPNQVTDTNKLTNNCVRIYYEICYRPYLNNQSNTTTTVNWITALHNNINTLYTNDEVKMALHEVFVWTTQDPYTGTYGENLAAFRANRQTFNGDLAHLVNSPSTTSVAYLNSLCTTNKYAYSGINQSYANVPTYSWTIMAMTHEMGHSLGSPHTHACAWNGDDTAIDGCGAQAGYSEGCTGPIPTGGGTIMSYCHLVPTGINFTKGFGPQPAALIRQTVESKGCLGTNCTTACALTITNFTFSELTKNSVKLTIADNTSASWKYRCQRFDGTIVASGETTERIFTVDNLAEGTYYKIFVGTSCSGPEAFQREVQILTDADWCSGIKFTDTGGENGNYENNQIITKTFYPSQTGQKLKLTFTEFDIEPRDGNTLYDYMTIYDGTSVASPRFANGNQLNGNNIPGPFLATNSAGAITVRFVSDAGLTLPGWSSYFECITLATDETQGRQTVKITPNPTSGVITIVSADKIISYQIYDASGKLVSSSSQKINSLSKAVDLGKEPAGTYVVVVQTEKEKVTQKVIKY